MLIGRIRGFEHELRPGAERSDSPFRERLGSLVSAALADALAARAIGGGSRIELARLHHATAGRAPAWQSGAEARAWLRRAIASGQVAVFRRVPPMGAMGHGEYAAMLGIDRGTVDHQAANAAAIDTVGATYWDQATKKFIPVPVTVSVFAGVDQNKALPNLTSDTCPAHNWRSESTETCDPSVHAWFNSHHVDASRQNPTLGSEGGGGFLATTTRVKALDPGTILYRYVNDPTDPYGGWWFENPLTGDPRVYAALPESSTAHRMVKATPRERITVLFGPGAPRCSNKPGGPDQILVAYEDFRPDLNNRLIIL